ncbi:hypothetical protein SVIOM74S_08470 [Streptomyces violarus]
MENGMVAVPPGRVTLSDRRTQRSWAVEVAPFRMSAFPVTQEYQTWSPTVSIVAAASTSPSWWAR